MSTETIDHRPVKTITIHVNKREVQVSGPAQTGLQIKEAAIAQGIRIQVDFLLALIGDRGNRVIGDSELIKVTTKSNFAATASDDNS